jgi:hypothetical protein
VLQISVLAPLNPTKYLVSYGEHHRLRSWTIENAYRYLRHFLWFIHLFHIVRTLGETWGGRKGERDGWREKISKPTLSIYSFITRE